MVMKNVKKKIQRIPYLFLLMLFSCLTASAQQGITVKGTVLDDNGETIIGASVVVKGNNSIGTISDIDGYFVLTVPNEKSVLVVSFVGMEAQEVKATKGIIRVILKDDTQLLDEVVVVGYGQQKKASVVGAITQTSGKTLERAGVNNLGAALTGNLPGVITSSSTGMPGAEDPKIIIRTQSSWNNSEPLVLVDGIEREMSSVDISSVENISVLKDASATAVYGVKGANGVILITTKRGKEGKANVQIKANMTAKVVSKLPEKYDAYDTFYLMNNSIEREAALNPAGWANYTPAAIIDKYRHPANAEEWDRYPNVDWEKELFKKVAMSYNTSVNVSGGTKVVNYFAAVDFVNEGDLFKSFENGRGYNSGFGYNRINVRSNLDFHLTKTTKFSTNLFGSNAQRQLPWNMGDNDTGFWNSAYKSAPDAMRPIYSNGMWGWYAPRDADVPNSAYSLAVGGKEKRTTTKMTTDFILEQDLTMLTKGLRFKANFSMDYTFVENNRGLNDMYNDAQRLWVNSDTGEYVYKFDPDTGTGLDKVINPIYWSQQSGSANMGSTYRKLYYSMQLDYARTFGKHEVTALGLFSRLKEARGSMFPIYREDWVFRLTYNYAMRYFFEANGAYNGSEKFGPDYRFAFFPSLSIGWMISEENFMKGASKWLSMLKLRASYGQTGNSNVGYRIYDYYEVGRNAIIGGAESTGVYASDLGNKSITWETTTEFNLGVDFGIFNNRFKLAAEYFKRKITDLLVTNKPLPFYNEVNKIAGNIGSTQSQGVEITLNTVNIVTKDFEWDTTLTLSHYNDRWLKRDPNWKPRAYEKEDDPIRAWWEYEAIGILQPGEKAPDAQKDLVPGMMKLKDRDGNGVLGDEDKVYMGNGDPKIIYGLNNSFRYKNFDLNIYFYGEAGRKRGASYYEGWTRMDNGINVSTYALKAFSSNNLTATDPTYVRGGNGWGDYYVKSIYYVRCGSITLGYKVPISQKIVNNLRVYVDVNNPFVITNWTGLDPETDNGTYAYPNVTSYNFGVSISF